MAQNFSVFLSIYQPQVAFRHLGIDEMQRYLHLLACADVGEGGLGEGGKAVEEGAKQLYYLLIG